MSVACRELALGRNCQDNPQLPEEHASERPDQETYDEGRMGRKDAGERIEIRKEYSVQHERSGRAI
jgi:hypothetical protein